MRAEIVDFKDLTDSRELLEAKPPKLFMIFTYILIMLIVVAFIWAYFGRIDIHISTQGIVRPAEQVSSVLNPHSGRVETVYFENGMRVNAGDVLYTLETRDFDFLVEHYRAMLAEIDEELADLRKYRESIEREENLFNPSDERYYTLVEQYLADIRHLRVQIREESNFVANQRADANLALGSISLSEQQKIREIANLEQYVRSVRTHTNLFAQGAHDFHLKFLDYERRYNAAQLLVDTAKRAYDTALELFDVGDITEAELNAVRAELNTVRQDVEQLRNIEILSTEARIAEVQQELEGLTIARRRAEHAVGTHITDSESAELTLTRNRLQLLAETDSKISVYESSHADVERELSRTIQEFETGERDFVVHATIDGHLNLLQNVTPGEFVPGGQEIATIIPTSADVLRIELAIPNRDIANIRIGQDINFNILALPYRNYGRVRGVVHSIGADARVNQFTGEMYFLVEAHIANEPVADHRGNLAAIQVGMLVEGQVITDNQRILTWFFELIQFWN